MARWIRKGAVSLLKLARQCSVGVTFHRAFDMCADQYQALEDIIGLGFERILTSGGKTTAMEGSPAIAHLVEKAAGRIVIMPGSGINETNVTDLVRFTGVVEVHSSAKSKVESEMKYNNDYILMGQSGDNSIEETNSERVRNIIRLANLKQPSNV